MRKLTFTFAFILIVLAGCNTGNNNKGLRHDQLMADATRAEKNGWIMIHLQGTPEMIGYQHGYLLASEISELKGAIDVNNKQSTGRNWEFFRNESYRILWHKIPDEYRRELQGITDGVNARLGENHFDVKDIVAINSFLEMSGYYVPWLDRKEQNNPPEHCSAVAATGSWTRDGKIVIAHNNWSEYLIGARWNIIIDLVPEKGNRIVMDALPGFIHSGDDFSINSAGLIVTETTITAFNGFDTAGVAEFVRARRSLQYASNIDEWAEIMVTGNNGGYANAWLAGDNKTGEIARLELGLKNVNLERTKDGYFTGANFPVNEKLLKEETSFDPLSADESANMRRQRWEELMNEYKGKIDIDAARSFMGDHTDMRRGGEYPGRFSLCGHLDEDSIGRPGIGWPSAYFAAGSVNGKVTDGTLASGLQFWGIAGHPCGQPFSAEAFLKNHPEYEFQKEYLIDMPHQEWILTDKIEIPGIRQD